ncbi:hypothetical protein [Texcoconibacillus texcoconensis]|uniref:Uncharacterized protein n=1 Tax=Texcoconibacillus texcoconensis TaxID=1095777 RepID=A0A840QTB3_9BACI|nr:hypothetical protein [Texcoconibacillus texcoconensis]MBB5174604.1 hypothetical protein [Texcoconibacillus texcoconensis]
MLVLQIVEDLLFMDGRSRFIYERFGIEKGHMVAVLDGVRGVIDWLRGSVFCNLVRDVTFYISDEPINFPAELALEEDGQGDDDCEVVVYLNVMSIAEDYKNGEYMLDLKRSDVACFEYAAFIVLHEVGHFVHANLGCSGRSMRDRLYAYLDQGAYFYDRYEAWMDRGYSVVEKKRYRRIPQEKAADAFAKQWLDVMMGRIGEGMD